MREAKLAGNVQAGGAGYTRARFSEMRTLLGFVW